MRQLRIYLDTSIVSFYYADDAPEKRDITREFFDFFAKPQLYDVYVSNIVIAEIEATENIQKRNALLDVLKDYPISLVDVQSSDEINHLAELYIENGIIPRSKLPDAYHVAIAVVNEMDILLSWNFRHLANVNREARINAVNLTNNILHSIRIISPLEVLNYDKE